MLSLSGPTALVLCLSPYVLATASPDTPFDDSDLEVFITVNHQHPADNGETRA